MLVARTFNLPSDVGVWPTGSNATSRPTKESTGDNNRMQFFPALAPRLDRKTPRPKDKTISETKNPARATAPHARRSKDNLHRANKNWDVENPELIPMGGDTSKLNDHYSVGHTKQPGLLGWGMSPHPCTI